MLVTSRIPTFSKKTALTIGNFDGLHLGHVKLVHKLVKNAKTSGLSSVVVTFKPHPEEFLNPQKSLPRITSKPEMTVLLEEHGIDYLVQLKFDEVLAGLSAETFWKKILLGCFNPAYIIVGKDHSFGKNRTGTPEKLRKMAADEDVQVDIETQLVVDGERVSSTRIRKLIFNGDITAARKLLGHGLIYTGVVQRGTGRGKTLGFPTANLYLPDRVLPPPGVYFSETEMDGKRYMSVSYIGKSPTFDGDKLWLETHLKGVNGNLYGKRITVDIQKWIRKEMQFASKEDLILQMERDLISAKTMLSSDSEEEGTVS
jgi:riboflavin kinase / FMN adenylyltransferase